MPQPYDLYHDHTKPKLAELLRAVGLDQEYVRARGASLTTADGRTVTDFIGGFGATFVGHNHPVLKDLVRRRLDEDVPAHAQVSVRGASARLAKRLGDLLPCGGTYFVNLSNSGTEAVEAAVKHAYKVRFDQVRLEYERISRILNDLFYKVEGMRGAVEIPNGKKLVDFRDDLDEYNLGQLESFQKTPVMLAFQGSFHGKTASSLKLTFNKSYREGYEGVSSIQPVFLDPAAPERIDEVLEEFRCEFLYPVLEADRIVLRPYRMTRAMGLILETIQGEGGIRPLPDSTLAWIAEHLPGRLPLLLDEIQTGCGRTGSFYAFGQTPLVKIRPEYVILSKALGGGLAKIGATLVRSDIYDHDFGILHTSTFGEDDLSAEVALATIDLLEADGGHLSREAQRKGDLLREGLEDLKRRHPDLVREVRGKGLMLAVEFTTLEERSPFFRASGRQGILSILIASYLLEHHGLRVLSPLTSMLKGNPGKKRMSVLRIQPPAVVEDSEIARLLKALAEVLDIVEANNEFLLVGHLLGTPPATEDRLQPRRFPAKWPLHDGQAHIDARVGFVVHPTTVAKLREYYFPSFESYGATDAQLETWWNQVSRFLEPVHVRSDLVRSHDFVVECNLVFVPYLPAKMVGDMPAHLRKELRDKVQDAVTLAKELGDDNIPVGMVGLGAFTSIATDNGTTVNDYEVAVTTGNAYTAALTLQGIAKAALEKDLELALAHVAVVGAAGNIGTVLSQYLASACGRLDLVGSTRRDSPARLASVKRSCVTEIVQRIRDGRGDDLEGPLAQEIALALADAQGDGTPSLEQLEALCPEGTGPHRIRILHDLEHLTECDVVVLSTNSAQADLVTPEMVSPDAIVCCTSVPSNLARDFEDAPDGIIAFDGGLAQLPEDSAIRFVGMPRDGMSYGCLAETLLLGFDGHNHSFCKGPLALSAVEATLAMAEQHGFELGALRRGDAVLLD